MVGHRLDHIRRRGGHISPDLGAFAHVVGRADRGGKDIRLEPVIVIDLADVGDQVQPIGVDVIQTSDERRNECCARLGRQKRLIGRETQRHVDHLAFARQHLARLETIPCQRHFDSDVVRDLSQLAALGDHVFRLQCHDLGADRTLDQVTDLLGHFKNIATGFLDQRRVGCHPVHHTQFMQFADRVDFRSVDKESHLSASLARLAFCCPCHTPE